jgi:hypothetical protein
MLQLSASLPEHITSWGWGTFLLITCQSVTEWHWSLCTQASEKHRTLSIVRTLKARLNIPRSRNVPFHTSTILCKRLLQSTRTWNCARKSLDGVLKDIRRLYANMITDCTMTDIRDTGLCTFTMTRCNKYHRPHKRIADERRRRNQLRLWTGTSLTTSLYSSYIHSM